MIRKLHPFIQVLNLHGDLNYNTAHILTQHLRASTFFPSAIAIRVDSQAGSLAQADNISCLIKNIQKEHHISVTAFIQGACGLAPYKAIINCKKIYGIAQAKLKNFRINIESQDINEMLQKIGASKTNYRAYPHLTSQVVPNVSADALLQAVQKVNQNVLKSITMLKDSKQLSEQEIKSLASGTWNAQKAVQKGLIDGIYSFGQWASGPMKDFYLRNQKLTLTQRIISWIPH